MCQNLSNQRTDQKSETERGPEYSHSQHAGELISAWKTLHKYNDKDTRVPDECYRRWLRSLLYLCYIFRTLINSLVCWFRKRTCTGEQPLPHRKSVAISKWVTSLTPAETRGLQLIIWQVWMGKQNHSEMASYTHIKHGRKATYCSTYAERIMTTASQFWSWCPGLGCIG